MLTSICVFELEVSPERLKLHEILKGEPRFGGVVAASFRSGRRKFALSLRIGQHSNTQKLLYHFVESDHEPLMHNATTRFPLCAKGLFTVSSNSVFRP
jgi:hypothetical protein